MGGVLKKPSSSDSVHTTSSITSPALRRSITSFMSLDYDFCRRTYWLCSECGNPRTGYSWCQSCEANRFESEFPHWTSGNIDIDDFIRQSQKNAYTAHDYLEWIPYESFVEVKYLASGGYGNVYTAYWKEGPRRPDSTVVADILEDWLEQLMNDSGNESTIRKEFFMAEEHRKKGNGTVSSPSTMVHPLSVYTSRLLEFPNLSVELNKS
ncbi:kinase-like domain-containing protein [Gigaspora margarita]|uniref:Kinase-like domain-containing protein n=1 Tax=Gigaspora margarita TaxID=4874 RepID=A0A8H4AM65_GIGMA|nr:kinase-like domain-containing protein [Gigaspora margarita]